MKGKNILKLLFILLIVIFMQISLSGCGGSGGEPSITNTNDESISNGTDTGKIDDEESSIGKGGDSGDSGKSETDSGTGNPNKNFPEEIVREVITNILTKKGKFAEVTETEMYTLPNGTPIEAAKDEILVLLREDITYEQLKTIIEEIVKLGGEVVGYDKDLLMLQVRTTKEFELMDALKNLGGVYDVGFNMVIEAYSFEGNKRLSIQEDRIRKSVFCDLPRINPGWWIDAINLKDAWKITRGSKNVVIGIVDSGIPAGQEILDESRLKRFDREGNEIYDDDTWNLKYDKYFHGLWVTGFAAGFRDDPDNCINLFGKNVRGVNHISNVIMVDINNRCGRRICKRVYSDLANAIKTAIEKGAHIVNISYGPLLKDCDDEKCKLDRLKYFREKLTRVLTFARNTNSLLVFASGNAAFKRDNVIFDCDSKECYYYARLWKDYTIVVGASSKKGNRLEEADFSNMGVVVDILAPGELINFAQYGIKTLNDVIEGGKKYEVNGKSGTSFAAPIVAGVASLIKSLNPSLTPPEIKYIILATAPEIDTIKNIPKRHLAAKAALEDALLTVNAALESRRIIFKSFLDEKTLNLNLQVPETGIKALDVLFLIDVTGSYKDDIATLQQKAEYILTNLNNRGLDIKFAVAAFRDFPQYPYGSPSDKPFYLLQDFTNDSEKVKQAIYKLDELVGEGGDSPEAQLEALKQAVDMSWRVTATKIIVLATDAPFHDKEKEPDYPGPSSKEVVELLKQKRIIVIGINSGTAEEDLQKIINATKGLLFNLSSDSKEIANALDKAISEIQQNVELCYEIITGEEFIKSISPITNCYAEEKLKVKPGDKIDINLVLTNLKQPTIKDKKYQAILWIRGNNSVLKKVDLTILITPLPVPPELTF